MTDHGTTKPKPALTRYDIETDQRVEVTQQWVDDVQSLIGRFGAAREACKVSIAVSQEFLDKFQYGVRR